MEDLLKTALSFLTSPLIIYIILIIKRKIKWLVYVFCIESAAYGCTISAICIFAIPISNRLNVYAGSIFYFHTIIILIFLVKLVFKPLNYSEEVNKERTSIRWVILLFCIGFGILGAVVFLWAIYVAKPAKLYTASFGYILLTAFSCYGFYYVSKINSISKPNLLRWVVILISGALLKTIPLVLSLIMIYAIPAEPKMSRPFLGGITFTGITFYSVLITIVASEYVFKIKNTNNKKSFAVDT